MQNQKRKRSENWDNHDKTLLQKLIEEQIAIIENKNTDTNTSKKKKDAWTKILDSFNICANNKRDILQIQSQWRKKKMYLKETSSNYKRSIGATGGGPPPKSPDPEDMRLMALMPYEFTVDNNEFDCDRGIVEVKEADENQEIFLEEFLENCSKDADEDEDTERYIQSPKKPLRESNEKSFEFDSSAKSSGQASNDKKKKRTSNYTDQQLKENLFDASMELKALEKEFLQIEHAKKVKLLDLQIKSMEEQIANAKEEHNLKMQRLLRKN